MRGTLLQVFFSFLLFSDLPAASDQEDDPPAIAYESIEVKKSHFPDFSMLVQERDEYATNLSRIAVAMAHAHPKDEKTLTEVRRMLGLSLQLSIRNRTAVVANHQLGKGILPEQKDADYSPQVFARLLLTRGKLLKAQQAADDRLVGRCFVEMAAALDPHNEDAVYESELQKIDDERVDWGQLLAE